jgi:hypothetical protein
MNCYKKTHIDLQDNNLDTKLAGASGFHSSVATPSITTASSASVTMLQNKIKNETKNK